MQVDCKKKTEIKCSGEYKSETGGIKELTDTFTFKGKFLIVYHYHLQIIEHLCRYQNQKKSLL